MSEFRATMPFPPSYNSYWRTGKRGSYISAEGKLYKGLAAQALCGKIEAPIEGDVAVTLHYYRPRKSGDLDNRFKQVLDSLQGVAYVNDSQIVEIHGYRHEDKDNPRVEVEVEVVKA